MNALGKKPASQDAVIQALETVAIGLGQQIVASEARLRTKIEAVDVKVDEVEARLTAKIDAVDAKVDEVEARLTAKIDAVDAKVDEVEARLTAKIDAVDAKVDNLRDDVVVMKQTMDENHVELNRKLNLILARLPEPSGE